MDDAHSGGLVDLDEFERVMGGSDSALEVFLKGHLWIERMLNGFIETAAPRPDLLGLDRMHFAAKVNLCEAFGLIPSGVAKSFRLLNKRGNELAHELTAALDDETVELMVTQSSSQVRAGFEAACASGEYGQAGSTARRLTIWFMVLVMDAGYGLLHYKYHKENEGQHIAYAAIRVVEEMYGSDPMPEEEARKRAGLPDPPHPREVWFRSSSRIASPADGEEGDTAEPPS